MKNESDFQFLSQMIYARIIVVGGGKLLSDTKPFVIRKSYACDESALFRFLAFTCCAFKFCFLARF